MSVLRQTPSESESDDDAAVRSPAEAVHRLWPSWLLWVAMVAAGAGFVAHQPTRMWAPFGPSHDGFNAALYMNGGRALLDDGPVASRLGALVRTVSGDRIVYAHHPPFVYVATAATASLVESTEAAARLPAVVSSASVVVLLAATLVAMGFGPVPSAVALLFALVTPMFTMFGATTEPHVLGLAPMTALLLLWHRARSGHSVSPWALALIGALAALTSWQAALFAAMVGAVMLVVDRRRNAALAVLSGTLAAAIVTGLWILWAYDGTTGDFLTRAVHRMGIDGAGRVSFRQAAAQQRLHLADLFPVGGWLVIPIAMLGMVNARTRLPAAVTLSTVLGYALVFKNGASDHNYWLYCMILPLTLGAAAASDGLMRWAVRLPFLRVVGPVVLVAVVVALIVTAWRPSDEERQRVWAAGIGAQARAIEWPARQRYAFHMFGGHGETDLLPWLLHYSRRAPYGVEGPESVPVDEIVLRSDEGQLVIVHGARHRAAE